MKICEYWRSRSFLDLGPLSFTYDTCIYIKIKLPFLSNCWVIFSHMLNASLYSRYKEIKKTRKDNAGHMTKMAAISIW